MAQSFIQLDADGTGKKVDTSILNTSLQHRQVFSLGDPLVDANTLKVNSDGSGLFVPSNLSASDIFTTTGIGPAHTPPVILKNWAIQVKGTGATPTLWTVVLEGSIDGVNYSPMMTHTQAIGEVILWSGTNFYPVTSFRTHVTILTLGSATNITVAVVGIS